MGWTEIRNDYDGIDDFVKRELMRGLAKNCEALDAEIVPVEPCNYNYVVYMAVRDNTDGSVFCGVDLVDFAGDSVCYKSLASDMGPAENECPERILKLLTRPARSETAEKWIRECETNLARAKFGSLSREIDGIAEKMIDQAIGKQGLIEKDIIDGTMKTHARSIRVRVRDGEMELHSPWMTTLAGFSRGEVPNYLGDRAAETAEYLGNLQVVDAFFDLAKDEDDEFSALGLDRPDWSDREAVGETADRITEFASRRPHLMETLAACIEKAEPDIDIEIGHGEKNGRLVLFADMKFRPALYRGTRKPDESLSLSFRETDLPENAAQFRKELEKTLSETFPGLKRRGPKDQEKASRRPG